MGFSLFPAIFDRPEKIAFADQEEDEYIELFLRHHWVTNVSWVFIVILGFVLPMVVVNLQVVKDLLVFSRMPTEIFLSLLLLWYMFIVLYAVSQFLHWYFNIYIITNKHLVDVNFVNLMSRDKIEVQLDDIQSVKSTLKGILGSLFNFGDVVIETAAEKQNINFYAVPKPDFVTERIQDLQEAEERSNNAG